MTDRKGFRQTEEDTMNIWGPLYKELATDAERLGWDGSGSFCGLCKFAGFPDRLGYPCAGPNRDDEIHIVSAAIRARLNRMHAERLRRQTARKRIASWIVLVLLMCGALLGVAALLNRN